MGSYASFKIKNYVFYETKSFIEQSLMSLFTEEDKIEEIEIDEDGDEFKIILYKTNIETIRTRLDILGFNLKTIQYIFEKNITNLKMIYDDQMSIEFLNHFTFDQFLFSLKYFYENDEYFFCYGDGDLKIIKNETYIDYISINFNELLNSDDPRFYLRGFLEKLDDNVTICYDLSEVIGGGYYDADDKIAEQSLKKIDKTIIFTEGKYDTYVIKRSLELLYPQYAKYFSFLDIELSKLELGASIVTKYYRAFISAGIANKVIILFDNDVEGTICENELLKIKSIPNNFCIMKYPSIKLSENYPTLCPNGIETLDINGSACSIELYLCTEVLKENDQFFPIQRKNYNNTLKKYQGSFSKKDKGKIQKKYKKILKECKRNKACIDKYDFSNMKTLLQNIFTAFKDKILYD